MFEKSVYQIFGLDLGPSLVQIFTTVFDQILEQISGPKFKTKSQNQILDYILAKFQAIIFYHIWT